MGRKICWSLLLALDVSSCAENYFEQHCVRHHLVYVPISRPGASVQVRLYHQRNPLFPSAEDGSQLRREVSGGEESPEERPPWILLPLGARGG